MMRILPALVLSVLALSAVGCADEDSSWVRKNRLPGRDRNAEVTDIQPPPPADKVTSAIKVEGTVDDPSATKVEINAMGNDGELTPIGEAKVENGKFEGEIPAGTSPSGVFILKAKGIGDAVVNSALINGIPAFLDGFLVKAPMDAVTSYKAEVLQVIAKKGVPGAQNFINVLDAYVDANLAGLIAVDSAVTNDAIELVGATADAVIAAEEVIEDALRKAGFPVNFDKLQAAQAATTAGIQKFVQDASNQRITSSKNLVAAFQKVLADAAAPIDEAIFNAVVNGGGAFGSKMKEKAPKAGFAASKSAFTLTSEMSSEKMTGAFSGTDLADKVKEAADAFNAAVGAAGNSADLETAKTAFLDKVLGRDAKTMFGPLDGFLKILTGAFQSYDSAKVAEMLGEIDACDLPLPSRLEAALGGNANVDVITQALKVVKKQQVTK